MAAAAQDVLNANSKENNDTRTTVSCIRAS